MQADRISCRFILQLKGSIRFKPIGEGYEFLRSTADFYGSVRYFRLAAVSPYPFLLRMDIKVLDFTFDPDNQVNELK